MTGITAAQSIAGVLAKVGAVGKDSRNTQQGFNFRGIDAVVNAVNPALRDVGGFIVPSLISKEIEHGTTKNGGSMVTVHLVVEYQWYGTDGGAPIIGRVASEASDMADKATAKAMSVAYRTYLLQTLNLPTDDPDPDSQYIERGQAPAVATQHSAKPSDKADAAVTAVEACTDPVKLDEIEDYAKKLGIAGVARVKDAIAAKRAELGPSNVDHWAVAEVHA